MDVDRCPVALEEVAEAYLLGSLPEVEARAFERHYVVCPGCAAILEATRSYLEAVKALVIIGAQRAMPLAGQSS